MYMYQISVVPFSLSSTTHPSLLQRYFFYSFLFGFCFYTQISSSHTHNTQNRHTQTPYCRALFIQSKIYAILSLSLSLTHSSIKLSVEFTGRFIRHPRTAPSQGQLQLFMLLVRQVLVDVLLCGGGGCCCCWWLSMILLLLLLLRGWWL